MTSSRLPADPALAAFTQNFNERHGLVPFAGGDTGGAAAIAPQPAPQQAAPQTAVAIQPQPGLQQVAPAGPGGLAPAQGGPQPPQQQQAALLQQQAPGAAQQLAPGATWPPGPMPQGGDPIADAAAAQQAAQQQLQAQQAAVHGNDPQAEAPPWAQPLIERMNDLNPAQPDPLAAELGLAPPPPDPAQQQAQAQQQATAQQQAAQAQAQLGQQGQPQPGTPQAPADPTQQMIQQWMREQARAEAQAMLDELGVKEFMQTTDVNRRRGEMQSLVSDYKLTPQQQQKLLADGRQYAAVIGRPDLAGEPGFLELTLLANHTIEQQRQAQQGQVVPGQVPQQVAGVPQQQVAGLQPPQGQQPVVQAPAQQQVAAAPSPYSPLQQGFAQQPQQVPIEVPGATQPGTQLTPEQQLVASIAGAKKGGGLNSLWVG